MWTENVTKKAPPPEVSFQAVDDQISQLDKDARESAFRQDVLKLTRDCAQLGLLYKSMVNHEKAERIQKVTHLKQQNTIGANFIRKFMSLNMKHVAGRIGELESAIDEARLHKYCFLIASTVGRSSPWSNSNDADDDDDDEDDDDEYDDDNGDGDYGDDDDNDDDDDDDYDDDDDDDDDDAIWTAMCSPWNPVSSYPLWTSWTNVLGSWCGLTSQSLDVCPTPTWMKPWNYCSLHSPGSQSEQRPLWSILTWSARRWQCRETFVESWGLPNSFCFPCVHGQKIC